MNLIWNCDLEMIKMCWVKRSKIFDGNAAEVQFFLLQHFETQSSFKKKMNEKMDYMSNANEIIAKLINTIRPYIDNTEF